MRLTEAWIAPPRTRELQELVRYRAELVASDPITRRRSMQCWLKAWVEDRAVSDLFGAGRSATVMEKVPRGRPSAQPIRSLLELVDSLDEALEPALRHG